MGLRLEIKALPNRTFYQAGIRYQGGLLFSSIACELVFIGSLDLDIL